MSPTWGACMWGVEFSVTWKIQSFHDDGPLSKLAMIGFESCPFGSRQSENIIVNAERSSELKKSHRNTINFEKGLFMMIRGIVGNLGCQAPYVILYDDYYLTSAAMSGAWAEHGRATWKSEVGGLFIVHRCVFSAFMTSWHCDGFSWKRQSAFCLWCCEAVNFALFIMF